MKPRPTATQPESTPTVVGCSSFKLRQLSRRVSQEYDAVLVDAGLKTSQYSLLSKIVKLGPIRPGQLAAEMEMDASTLTRNLQSLVAQRWATIGPGEDALISLPSRAKLGEIRRTGDAVWFYPASGSDVYSESRLVEEPFQLIPDIPGPANQLKWGTYQFWLLQRGERLAIRVRDQEAVARHAFHGLTYFPWNADSRISARFVAHPPGETLSVSDVTGATKEEPNPGALVFTCDGKEYQLEALADMEAGDLFILFQDVTNGKTTYAPGRFLHAPYPDGTGQVMLDFNRAYNPPCAFTDFATCPRAPRQNRLPFAVNAGEKLYQK